MEKLPALDALTALSQATRLDVFRLLVTAGHAGLPAGDIATRLDVRQNTLSAHLGVLRNAALVERQREGRIIRYRADYATMCGLLKFLVQDCCAGADAIRGPLTEALADCTAG